MNGNIININGTTSHGTGCNRRNTATVVAAAIAAGVLALSGCGSSNATASDSGTSGSTSTGTSSSSGTFTAAGLFPQTGSMAYIGPSNVASLKLAAKDINAAGGVLGKDIETVTADTSDADHADQNSSAAQSVLSKNPSVVVGPPSSSVVKNSYKQVVAAGVPMISNGATSTAFSGMDDLFFRTIPPDTVQGAVLGQIIAQDGVQNLAIAVFNDEYGTSLRDVVVKTVEDAGLNVVYGAKDTFDPTETNFSSIATAIKAAKPDAVLVIAFDQTKSLVKALKSAGIDTHKLYMTDGNTVDHSADFDAGLLEGSTGTIPGAHPTEEFQGKVKAIDPKVVDFTYAAETYDATVLAALAAQKGGATDGATVAKNLPAVSGVNGGEECSSYADCLALLKDGKDIKYKGQAGIGPFNDDHDPSTAAIGVYKFDKDNKPVFDHAQEGAVPTK
ncbi:ABC transporter substrate-binding protein [Bifidobacterium amazonense]|uniref:ABC transporter substrate-binding protein n=1 Tax=Bifidobacterium amazonense TaxID=2809027 RepID=A0ABS9VX11_9BIFI|nr:ABC transporter substrate-binding protein [Bifidobacterium amazonense]MCH9276514.1 ABC transporter substrate-binding protein [Bifidobacterium amazonense]